jgi:hypothetical protein
VGLAEAECSRIVRENEAGIVVDNGDVAGLVRAIRQLRGDADLRRRTGPVLPISAWSRTMSAGAWGRSSALRSRFDPWFRSGAWTKPELVDLFSQTLSRFSHKETFKYLDDRM